jgi:hypothetical protein
MPRHCAGKNSVSQLLQIGLLSRSLFLNYYVVKQERLKKKDAKKPKTPRAAGKEFLDNLLAP